jgi:hypothetical protein
MTAVVILNIVFAAFVVVGMLSLLVGAIVADRRASGARLGLERGVPVKRFKSARSWRAATPTLAKRLPQSGAGR